MGKVLKIVAGGLILAAGIALAATGAGGVLLAGFLTLHTGTIIAMGAAIALGGIMEAFMSPKIPEAQLSRLSVRLDPNAPRKMVFGTTAFPLDLRYHEGTGTDQEYIEYIIALAAHEVVSIDEIWFEQDKAWDSTSGVTSKYSGYLTTVTTRLEGTSGNAISVGSGTVWSSSNCRLTGCAYVYLKIKRTGNDDKSQSPLVNGLPSRVTIRGQGIPLYDPRLDSNVTGGSGSQDSTDQTTWGTGAASGDEDNPALQLLTYLLGWKINSKLSVGCGIPPARIDLESFITAANICDESISLSGGGTQERYRTSGAVSDSDGRMDVINTFLTCMNGTLRDSSGKLALTVMKNDLASYVLDLDDNDILGEFQWNQTKGLEGNFNVVRGRYVDPSDEALYQFVEYPEVSVTSIDGIERMTTLDLPFVEEGRRAQRIAKQVLQRNQYRGTFGAVFTAKALGCSVGEVVRLTFAPLGWVNKLFRVIEQEINLEGTVPMVLLEENEAIYAWDAEESAPVTVTAPVVYDPLNNPFILADIDAANVVFTDPSPFNILADSTGTTTTDLSTQTRSISMSKNGTAITTSVTVGTITGAPSSAITATASVSSGVVTVTLTKADAPGYVNVPITYNGKTYTRTIVVNRTTEAGTSGGGTGATTFTDLTWGENTVNSTTYVQVTDSTDNIVESNGSGQIQVNANASYWGGAVTIKAQYSTDNSTWNDISGTETTGSAPITVPGEEEPGFVSFGATTQGGLTANTDYYVRLLAKRTASTGTISFESETFNATQP